MAPGIDGPEDLAGRRLASPQLGNTQDVALRTWLRAQGYRVDLSGDSDVVVVPQDNAQTLETFRSRQIAGAWVPEPWATRLIREGAGYVLVDERALWPDGRFVTTHLVVRAGFLRDHEPVVRALVRGHVRAGEWVRAEPEEAQEVVNDAIGRVTGRELPPELIAAAWANLEFTDDPLPASLAKSAADAEALGLLDLEGLDVSGIYDLGILEEVRAMEMGAR